MHHSVVQGRAGVQPREGLDLLRSASVSLPDPDRVAALLRAAAREEILPRFRALAADEIHRKDAYGDPNDVVTEADLAMERRISPELLALLPGSVVVGEEAAAADERILGALDGDAPVWLVDPVDGTKNFAAGSEDFGAMLALVAGGATVMSWIHLPCRDAMYVAESGAGATLDGRRFAADAAPVAGSPAGSVYGRISMPPDEFARLDSRAAATGRAQPYLGSAAVEYTSMLRGRKDYVVYHRLLPWDHAPGALLVAEAGGRIGHADGAAYEPRHRYRTLLAARTADAWDSAHAALFG
jgi:fructose-1,6-bisphosphatase/inositol monophosphatase family enzyme